MSNREFNELRHRYSIDFYYMYTFLAVPIIHVGISLDIAG